MRNAESYNREPLSGAEEDANAHLYAWNEQQF